MSKDDFIPLDRQFSVVPDSQQQSDDTNDFTFLNQGESVSWAQLEKAYRCVILAEAGAGKTQEFLHQARRLAQQGKASFFIRIEDIDSDFSYAFEVGDQELFEAWLGSDEEAWFFLDSIDEARLEAPKAFRQALLRFKREVKGSAHRAHLYLSSRPWAWHFVADRKLLEDHLPDPGANGEDKAQDDGKASPAVYSLKPLDSERIRHFSSQRGAADIERLLREIERTNLWSLAQRPFDLDNILAKWVADQSLDGRLQLLNFNIDRHLSNDHNPDHRSPLTLMRAQKGARALAAAVVLTGQPGISLPDSSAVKPGIKPEQVLTDWTRDDLDALLELAIFNDVIYQAVRFRHREIRELLTAQWLNELLQNGTSRRAVESLVFRESYGEQIITPRLRPVLPWLVLLDDDIRRKALSICPEIAVEGGDPAQLPKSVRQTILRDIVRRIASGEDGRGARDNSAIARIAQPDLSEDTRELIAEYQGNNDAIFFLGRLVWQGEMSGCVEPLVELALDAGRGLYARRASIRAVMTCGSDMQKQQLWQRLNACASQLPAELLTELLQESAANGDGVALLIASLGRLPLYERYKATGLSESLRGFIERIPFEKEPVVAAQFIKGLRSYLQQSPFIDRMESRASKEYVWLLDFAADAVARLIETRNAQALSEDALAVLLMVPVLRAWHRGRITSDETTLRKLIPGWPELNDALYWAGVEQARVNHCLNSEKSLAGKLPEPFYGHLWSFNDNDLPRLLDQMKSRSFMNDRQVALRKAFRVYQSADDHYKEPLRCRLQEAVADCPVLLQQLNRLLNPPVSKVSHQEDEAHAKYMKDRDEEDAREKQEREVLIAALRADPDQIRHPEGVEVGECSHEQKCLLNEIQGFGISTSRSAGANWQMLVPEFGDELAQAYCDAAIDHWRRLAPVLASLENSHGSISSESLEFALSGLEIEAALYEDFPQRLSRSEVAMALSYITWELNGFPCWFERMYAAFPDAVEEAVIGELRWELENTAVNQPMRHILYDLIHHALWLHRPVALVLLAHMEAGFSPANINRQDCLCILISGQADPARLAALAKSMIAQATGIDDMAFWYALRVDCDPEKGVLALESWLSGLGSDTADQAFQLFITYLIRSPEMGDGGLTIGYFRSPTYLKTLYKLAYRHIRAEDDIDRSGQGVYSPELRDKAQQGRGRLFNILNDIPGKESYLALKALSHEHPDPDYHLWMQKSAYKRAEKDGDIEPWCPSQVAEFIEHQTLTPTNHRQLFDLTVQRLQDLKHWLEKGNDSPAENWQLAPSETKMRNLIAGWLGQNAEGQYSVGQELELANAQRMDITLSVPGVPSPLPIELKLLDKGWSGNQLCDALGNQLVGDYLREENAEYGVLLLVSQHAHDKKKKIADCSVGLDDLADTLKAYWHQQVSANFPGVKAIEVIVIDLAVRSVKLNI